MNRRGFIRTASKLLFVPAVGPIVARMARANPYLPVLAGKVGNGLLNGLVGYYALDEGTASLDFADSSVNGRTLTQTNSPQTGTGLLNGCRVLNGSTNSRRAASSDAAFAFSTDMTVSFWAKLATNDTTARGVAAKSDTVTDKGWVVRKNTSKQFEFLLSADGTNSTFLMYTGITLTSTTAWYHVIARFSGTTMRLAVTDSTTGTVNADVTTSFTGPIHSSAVSMVAGGYFSSGTLGSFWNGSIDELAIFNVAVNDDQKALLYNGGSPYPFSSWTS